MQLGRCFLAFLGLVECIDEAGDLPVDLAEFALPGRCARTMLAGQPVVRIVRTEVRDTMAGVFDRTAFADTLQKSNAAVMVLAG
jgi:hypothetical protein